MKEISASPICSSCMKPLIHVEDSEFRCYNCGRIFWIEGDAFCPYCYSKLITTELTQPFCSNPNCDLLTVEKLPGLFCKDYHIKYNGIPALIFKSKYDIICIGKNDYLCNRSSSKSLKSFVNIVMNKYFKERRKLWKKLWII